MNSVIIFDVHPTDSTKDVRRELTTLGYFDYWSILDSNVTPPKRSIYYLPHNTMWKKETDTNRAIADLNAVVALLNTAGANKPSFQSITVIRCIVLNSTPWNGIIGLPVI